ncbi:UNVERIFIED_CONTAM: hypothetical protein GTU68_000976 [Idotea baltica]|nr:hypothetical protein [Idotea baltica]
MILGRISFEVRLGDFVYIVGKTGAGKSTLLKLLYADCMPVAGKVQVGDFVVNELVEKQIPMLRRKLGIVFQDFQLLPDRDIYNNILFALKATGWRDKASIKRRINEVLMMVGLAGKARSFPHQMSGGEQQRAAIARALINDPIVLVADEPTGNLDPEATAQVMGILKKINLAGTAVMMATHEYPIIRDYPSRVLEVSEHQLFDHATPESFLSSFNLSNS